MKSIRTHLLLISIIFLTTQCERIGHDYHYKVVNLLEDSSAISISYTVRDGETKCDTIFAFDTIKIAERLDVAGKNIWDVETSISLYKIAKLNIQRLDSQRISEELSYKRFWKGPEEFNGIGIYELIVNDSILSMYLQPNYVYQIQSSFDDTITIITTLKDKGRRADTIIGQQVLVLGSVDIYTYPESSKDLPKYKTQKISGISAISVRHNNSFKTINTNKDASHFLVGKDTCILNITEDLFK